jgi:hypothetical protein
MSKAPTGMEFVGKLPDVPADAFFPNRATLTPGGVADAVRRLMSAVREATDARDAEIIALRKALAGSSEPSRETVTDAMIEAGAEAERNATGRNFLASATLAAIYLAMTAARKGGGE